MNSIAYRLAVWPHGYLIERAVLLAPVIAVLLLTFGCATKDAAPVPAEVPLTRHDANAARALALQKIGETAKDAETQRLAIFALLTMDRGSEPAAAAPVVVQGRTLGDAAIGFVGRVFDGVERLAVPFLTYRGQVRSAETTERIAAINRDVSVNQSNNFLGLGVAGINGTASVGTAGVNALASVATAPRPAGTQVTVSGNSGPVQIGSGTQTNSSNNPVNPAPVVCLPGTTTTAGTCSR